MTFDIKTKAADLDEVPVLPERKMWVEHLRQGVLGALSANIKDINWLLSDSFKIGSFLWTCSENCLDLRVVKEIRERVLDKVDRDNIRYRVRHAKNRYSGYYFVKRKRKNGKSKKVSKKD